MEIEKWLNENRTQIETVLEDFAISHVYFWTVTKKEVVTI